MIGRILKYKETKPYQNMSGSQKAVFDYWDEHDAFKSRKPKAMGEVTVWKAEQDAMTPAERDKREDEIKLENRTAGVISIGLGIALAAIVAMLIVGEMTGNPLIV